MRFSTWSRILSLALAAAALFAGGCASPGGGGGGSLAKSPLQRIRQNQALFDTWPFDVQNAILNGQVIKGMNHQMVLVALGKPDGIEQPAPGQGGDELWIYTGRSERSGSSTNYNIGLPLGDYGIVDLGGPVGGGSNRQGPAPEVGEVLFKDGIVVRTL